jgi:hypothetical protein
VDIAGLVRDGLRRETIALVANGRHYHAVASMPQRLTHGLRDNSH